MREVLVVALGALGALLCLAAAAGVAAMRDAYDRLHYVSLTVPGGVALAAAVVVREGPSLIALKAVLVAGALLTTTPVLTHATARALVHRSERHRRRRQDEG